MKSKIIQKWLQSLTRRQFLAPEFYADFSESPYHSSTPTENNHKGFSLVILMPRKSFLKWHRISFSQDSLLENITKQNMGLLV
jgi:hypothetical protein